MRILKLFPQILLLFFGATQVAIATPEFDSTRSLEWHRIKLEDQVRQKLKENIIGALGGKPYFLTVSIEMKPLPKEEPKAQKKKEKKLDDLIPLGKLDLDAPYLGYDEEKKFEDDKPEPIDLFKLILKVKVSLLIDNSVEDAKKDILKRVLLGTVGSMGDTAPDVSVEKAELIAPPKEKEEKPWDAKKWVLEFKNPAVILLSTILFGLFCIMIFSQYLKLESRKIAVLEAQSAREEAAVQKAAEDNQVDVAPASSAEGSPDQGLGEEASNKGFEQFQSLLKKSPKQVIPLVKQWIRAPGKGSTEALVSLPIVLSTEDLLSIFDQLTLEDRKEWKKALNTTPDSSTLRKADAFISTQIVESLLVPSVETDEELQNLLNDLKTSDCVELAQNPDMGAVLVNLLPTSQVSLMFALLSVDVANAVTAASLKISDEDLKVRGPDLKIAIRALKNKTKAGSLPFLDKAVEMLKDVTPDKEASIFSALANAREFTVLQSAAQKLFPSELVIKLPEKVMKSSLERLPVARRADFIYSQDEANRAIYLDALGKTGSKARALIEVEIEQIAQDETRKRRIEKNKGALSKQFIDTVRNLINSSESIAEQTEGVLKAWLAEKSGGELGGGVNA